MLIERIMIAIMTGTLVVVALCIVFIYVSDHRLEKQRMKENIKRNEQNKPKPKPLHITIPEKGTYVSLDNGMSGTLIEKDSKPAYQSPNRGDHGASKRK